MKIKTILFYFFIATFALFSSEMVADDGKKIDNPKLILHAQALEQYGTLQKKGNGFTYVKVNDAYIHTLFEMLAEDGWTKPAYFRRADAPGAHVSVLYEKEGESLATIPGIGTRFHFEVKELVQVRARKNQLIVLRVVSPELEQYRRQLGFSPKLLNHEFHITIAKKAVKRKAPNS